MTSIVLATYNGAAYLNEQITSILEQTTPPASILIRDDGSKDQTLDLLKEWKLKHPQRIQLVNEANNLGIIGNFSKLLSMANTAYVALSDQDDVWNRDKLEQLEKAMLEQEALYPGKPHLIHSDAKVVDQDLRLIAPSFMRYAGFNPEKNSLPRLLTQNHVTGCTILVNQALIQKALPIPSDCPMHDGWLALIAAAFGTIRYINQPLILYRQHGGNDTGATRYSAKTLLERFTSAVRYKKMKELHTKKVAQAKHLIERYQNELKPYDQAAILAFIELRDVSLFKKIQFMWKYDLRKAGFLRQIGDIFLS